MYLLKNTNFFLKILNDGLLFAVEPTGQAQEQKVDRIHRARMRK